MKDNMDVTGKLDKYNYGIYKLAGFYILDGVVIKAKGEYLNTITVEDVISKCNVAENRVAIQEGDSITVYFPATEYGRVRAILEDSNMHYTIKNRPSLQTALVALRKASVLNSSISEQVITFEVYDIEPNVTKSYKLDDEISLFVLPAGADVPWNISGTITSIGDDYFMVTTLNGEDSFEVFPTEDRILALRIPYERVRVSLLFQYNSYMFIDNDNLVKPGLFFRDIQEAKNNYSNVVERIGNTLHIYIPESEKSRFEGIPCHPDLKIVYHTRDNSKDNFKLTLENGANHYTAPSFELASKMAHNALQSKGYEYVIIDQLEPKARFYIV